MTASACAANASLSSTSRGRRPSSPARASSLLRRGHRADAHHARIDAGRRRRRRTRRAARGRALARRAARRDHERGGAVVEPLEVARGDRAALAERGLAASPSFAASCPARGCSSRDVDGRPSPARAPDDLAGEAARSSCAAPARCWLRARTRPGPRARCSYARRRSRRSRPSPRAGRAPPSAGSGSASRAGVVERAALPRGKARVGLAPSPAARASSSRRRRRRTRRPRRRGSRGAACATASRPEAHSRFTVTPGDRSRQARRAAPPCARRCGCPRRPGSRSRGRPPRSRPASTPARSTAARDRERGEVVGAHAGERAAVAPDRRAHRREDHGAAQALLLVEHALRDRERAVRRRNAAVDRALQQHLLDLVRGQAVPERRADVHRQLVLAPERDERRQRDRAPHPPVEARPRPDLAPGVARDQVLEVRRERRRLRDRRGRRARRRAPRGARCIPRSSSRRSCLLPSTVASRQAASTRSTNAGAAPR